MSIMNCFKIMQVKVKGITINYATAGKGKPLVFIHGWTNNWMGWIPLAKILKNNYKLYILDLPGFGDSDSLQHYSAEIAADYLAGFIKKLKIKPEAVIGLSMGTFVTSCFGKNYPKLTKTIVLIGAVFKDKKRKVTSKFIEFWLKLVNGRKRAESVIKKIIETRFFAYLTAKYLNMYEFNKFLIDTYGMIGKKKMKKEAYIQMGISVTTIQLQEVLDNIKVPVLLIYGKQDKLVNIRNAWQNLKRKKGNFNYRAINKAGHIVSLERPRPVAEAITDFLQKYYKA